MLGPVTDKEVARKEVQRLRRGVLEAGLDDSFLFSCLNLARLTAPLILPYLEELITSFEVLWTGFKLACGPGFVLVIPVGYV